MTPLPNLNALRAFEAAGRHLNFRAAAQELGVTQGAVAQQVRGLEARLGLRLFERLPRGLRFTEDGRRYHAPLVRAFGLIAEATEAVAGHGRRLSVSVTPSFASKWLVPRLGGFAVEYPEIAVQVDASERLANFQSDGIDVAVRQGRPPFGPGLTAEPLFAAQSVAVCAPGLKAGPPPLVRVSDLAGHALLVDAHGLWPLYLEGAGAPRPRQVMEFSQASLAIDAAIAGQGVALADLPLVADALAAGRLVRAFDHALPARHGFYIVTPRRPRQPELVEKMTGWLLGQARNPQPGDGRNGP